MFTARYGLSAYIKEIRLVFITEVESVYSAVRTECLYKTQRFSTGECGVRPKIVLVLHLSCV